MKTKLIKVSDGLWRNQSGSLRLSKRMWARRDERWYIKWNGFLSETELSAPTRKALNSKLKPYGMSI